VYQNIPICQQKWEIYFGVELPWEEIWGRRFKNLANRKSKQLQWKVIHRIIGNPVSFITQSIEYFSGIYKYFTILIPDIFHRFKPTFGEIGQK
jgi:hypothetical protein